MTTTPGNRSDQRPVELPPDQPSTLSTWVHVLAGPTIFMAHFGVAYLLAETSCAADRSSRMAFFGPGALRAVVVAMTVLAAAASVASASRSFRRFRVESGYVADLALVGLLLAVGSFVAVLALGVPALVLDPC